MIQGNLKQLNLKQKAIKGVKITAAAFVLIKTAALIRHIVLARILAPEDFGLIAFCLVVVGLLENLSNLRIHDAVIQTGDNEQDMLRAGFIPQLLLSAVFVCAVLILSQKISYALGRPSMRVYLNLLALRILTPAVILPQALLHREFKYKSIKIPEISEALVNTAVSIILAVKGFGIWSLAWGIISGWLVWALLILLIARGWPGIHFKPAPLKKALSFGAPLYLTCILVWGFWNMDDFIVGSVLGNQALGFYWLAFYLAHHLIDLRFILSKVSFPVFSRLQGNRPKQSEALSELTKTSAFIFLLIAALLIPLAHPALGLVFGSKWIPAAVPFMIFIAIVSLRSVFEHGSELLLGAAKTRYILAVSLLQFVVLLVLGPAATSRLGISGMALTIFLAVALSIAALLNYVRRIIAISYIRILWRPFVIAACVSLVAFLARGFAGSIIGLSTVLIACSALYFVLFMAAERLFMHRFKSYFLTLIRS